MNRVRPWVLCGVLVVLSGVAYSPLCENGFVDYDDENFIVNKPYLIERPSPSRDFGGHGQMTKASLLDATDLDVVPTGWLAFPRTFKRSAEPVACRCSRPEHVLAYRQRLALILALPPTDRGTMAELPCGSVV